MTALFSAFAAERARAFPHGAVVGNVRSGSPAARAGLMPGDMITHVDDEPIGDFLDFYVAAFGRTYALTVRRGRDHHVLQLERQRMEDTGIEIEPGKPMACSNKCVFCFVDQLPEGLRGDLYVKDEDYRLSFLHGNYVTLSNLKPEDEARIKEVRLSPLYVSVHATDEELRARLLGRRQREPILNILNRLADAGIKFHTQVVVVPGYNDGAALERTLRDLVERHEFILSISVVPVGLTSQRDGLVDLEPVGPKPARHVAEKIKALNVRMRQTIGRGLVYASDELLLTGRCLIPLASYYDDFPQIENGVGLLRQLLDSARHLRVPAGLKGRNLVFVTGVLAGPFIEEIASKIGDEGVRVGVTVIENGLFGSSATVTGLLSGKGILSALAGISGIDAIVLPPNVINETGITLDDTSPAEMAEVLAVPVVVGEYDMNQTLERLHGVLG